MKPTLKAPGSKRLKVEYEKLLSNCALNFNLRRYNVGSYRLLVPDQSELDSSSDSSFVVSAAAAVTFAAAASDPRWVVTVNGSEVATGATSAAFTVGFRALSVVIRVAPPPPPTVATDANADADAAVTAATAIATATTAAAAAAAAAAVPQASTATATYVVRVMRASSSSAAAAANPALALLHITLDTGESFNSTELGGAAWPECATGRGLHSSTFQLNLSRF
jgi:hypothetical protein